ncbi:hypothetical protein [Coprobacter sp.]
MKILFYCLSLGVLLLGCSVEDDSIGLFNDNEPQFPSHIEKCGKELAKNIEQTVAILNKQGVDYSDADYSQEFYERFYTDWFGAVSIVTKSEKISNQSEIDPLVLVEKYRNLTPVQRQFIKRIETEGSQSRSYEEFCTIIKKINQDIYNEVPKIEQERLLLMTSFLYYGLSKIYHLQTQGKMLITPQTNLQLAMVKTRSESGSGGFWQTCRKIYEATCSYVVGAVIATGEFVSSISLEAVVTGAGTVMMYAVLLCLPGDTETVSRERCIDLYADKCISGPCDDCLHYCVSSGKIDPRCEYKP